MFKRIRQLKPAYMASFMACCGVAASIKPPVLGLALSFLIATCWLVHRRQNGVSTGWRPFLLWTAVGGSIPAAMVAVFLLKWGVTRDFLINLRGLTPYYASLQREQFTVLFAGTFVLSLITLSAANLFLMGRSWRRWESSFLLGAVFGGAALFIAQGKGWDYHLYPEIMFLALWALLECDSALKASRYQQIVAVVTLFVVGVTAIQLSRIVRAATYPAETMSHLQTDLENLGGSTLSGRVQCLDMTLGGCINVLYRMQLVQSTGFMSDFYLFPERGNTVTDGLQHRFLEEITIRPPELIVLSSHT